MRIFHVVPCYVNLDKESGGVANVVRQLAIRQAEMGDDVVVLCTTTELNVQVGEPGELIHSSGVKVLTVYQNSGKFALPSFDSIKIILDQVKLDDKTLFHFHAGFSFFIDAAMLMAKMLSVNYIYTPHGKLSNGMFSGRKIIKSIWWYFFSRYAVAGAKYVVYMGDDELGDREGYITKRTRISQIPNGYDSRAFDNCNVLNEEFGCDYFIFLGYLDPRKRPDFLVRAFAEARCRNDVKLIIVGPDKYGYKKYLTEIVEKKFLSDRVIFFGPAYGNKKISILRGALALCLPSKGEGMPVVLSEAVGAGVPSIYSKECNFSLIANNGAGFCIDDDDLKKWADALDCIFYDRETRYGMVDAVKVMSKDLSWDKITKEWKSIYLMTVS